MDRHHLDVIRAGISKAARQLLESCTVGDEPLRRSATILNALPVLALDGELHSWFVPVTVGKRLTAFFQFLPDSTLMRFSSFCRRPGEFDGCPVASDWLDRDRIKSRAAEQRQMDETTGEPFLTYDRTPDRLVWAVPLTHVHGDVRLLYVAENTVYSPLAGDTFG